MGGGKCRFSRMAHRWTFPGEASSCERISAMRDAKAHSTGSIRQLQARAYGIFQVFSRRQQAPQFQKPIIGLVPMLGIPIQLPLRFAVDDGRPSAASGRVLLEMAAAMRRVRPYHARQSHRRRKSYSASAVRSRKAHSIGERISISNRPAYRRVLISSIGGFYEFKPISPDPRLQNASHGRLSRSRALVSVRQRPRLRGQESVGGLHPLRP